MRIACWLRRKHRIGWPALKRKFCVNGWRFAIDGVTFTGAASVTAAAATAMNCSRTSPCFGRMRDRLPGVVSLMRSSQIQCSAMRRSVRNVP